MAKPPAVLGVHLTAANAGLTRVGTLTRDAGGATAFIVDEAYLRNPRRPILSVERLVRDNPAETRKRLERLHGSLPPWFRGLRPEGALRDLVLTEMGRETHRSAGPEGPKLRPRPAAPFDARRLLRWRPERRGPARDLRGEPGRR